MPKKFKEFILEEGDLWDALKCGVKAGIKAFAKKRDQQAHKDDKKTLTQQILSAEGKELEALVKKIVDNGYTIQNGKVEKPPTKKHVTDWLLECINTRMASRYAKLSEEI